MKVLIDDTWNKIDDFTDNKVGRRYVDCYKNEFAFDDVVKMILTKGQYESFILSETKRVFVLSNKKQKILLNISANGLPNSSAWKGLGKCKN